MPRRLAVAVVAAVGAGLVAADVAHRSGAAAVAAWRWNAALDGSWFELHRAGLLLTAAVVLLLAGRAAGRAPVLVVWPVVLVAVVADDLLGVHERAGSAVVAWLGIQRALGLRAQDLGELTAWGVQGAVLLGAVAVAVAHACGGAAARRASRAVAGALVLVAAFAVGVDMLGSWLALPTGSAGYRAVATAEFVGETAGAAVLLAVAVRARRRLGTVADGVLRAHGGKAALSHGRLRGPDLSPAAPTSRRRRPQIDTSAGGAGSTSRRPRPLTHPTTGTSPAGPEPARQTTPPVAAPGRRAEALGVAR